MKLPARWKELSPLLDTWAELDPPAREPWLQALRQRDPSLADELAALLDTAARAQAQSFLEQPLDLAEAAVPTLLGRHIGPYVIEAELGEGGSGRVWRARRVDGRFEAVVAIKLLHLSLLGRAGVGRFQQEGAILSRLQHPNIARLLDAGVTPEGQPYLILEYIDGQPLDVYCDQRSLGIPARLRLLRDVMHGVSHAHAQLVVHRDIKPSNILVTADGQVKLLDFGIAKLLQHEAHAELTGDGRQVLTPRYAAPEQLAGALVSTATDVYALGVLAYRLLAGRYPTSPERSEPQRLSQALLTPPAPGDAEAPQVAASRGMGVLELTRTLRGDLDAITGRALRQEPGERYTSVAAFDDDLGRYLESLPVLARAGSASYRLRKLAWRHRWMVGAGALLVLSIAAGLAGTVSQAHRAERERDAALRQLRGAESTREFVQFLLSEGVGEQPMAPELLERGERLVASEFSSDPDQQARLLLLLGRLYGEANIQRKAQALLEQAQQVAQRTADARLRTEVECQLAWQLADNGSPAPVLPRFDAAIAALRAVPTAHDGVLANCLYGRGEARNKAGDLQGALRDVQEALQLIGEPRPDQRTEAILMRARMASIQGRLGQSAVAAAELRRALQDLQALGRGQSQSARTLHNNLGVLLYNAGRPLEAVQSLSTAVEISRRVGHPDATAQGNFARALIDVGRAGEATQMTESALGALANVQDAGLRAAVASYGAPGWCAVGDLARCRQLVEQAQAQFAAAPPPDRAALPSLALRRAGLLAQEGNASEARKLMQQAAIDFKALGHRGEMNALALLARLDLQASATDEALAHAQQAVALAQARREGFEHTAWLGSALLSLGLVQRARGNEAGATASLRAALAELRDSCGDAAPETRTALESLGR